MLLLFFGWILIQTAFTSFHPSNYNGRKLLSSGVELYVARMDGTVRIELSVDATIQDLIGKYIRQSQLQETRADDYYVQMADQKFEDGAMSLADAGICSESVVEIHYNPPSDCYKLTRVFVGGNVFERMQGWSHTEIGRQSNACCEERWPGITCEENRVMKIGLYSKGLTGTVNLTQLPSALQRLSLGHNQFTGTVDLTQLPSALQWLSLEGNQFNGNVDLTQLPSTLQWLYLGHNQFTGTVDLTQLPSALKWLSLEGNQFNGTVDLTQLPSTLQRLRLADNQFTGTVDLTQLPSTLQRLRLADNQFTGNVDRTQLPSGCDLRM